MGFETFSLSEGEQQEIFPSLRFIVTNVFVSSQFNVTADFFYFFVKSQMETALRKINSICWASCIAVNYLQFKICKPRVTVLLVN